MTILVLLSTIVQPIMADHATHHSGGVDPPALTDTTIDMTHVSGLEAWIQLS